LHIFNVLEDVWEYGKFRNCFGREKKSKDHIVECETGEGAPVTDKTPGCDLFISHFIWGTTRNRH